MRKILPALAALFAIAPLGAASAQSMELSAGIAAEAMLAQAFDVEGVELGIGGRFSAGPIHFTPMIGGFIYQSDNDRYRYYDQSNGRRCRDTTNGQYAKDALCDDTAVSAYGRLELTASVDRFEAGVGYRIADEDSILYGTISVNFGEHWAVKGNAGKDYLGLGVTFR